MGQLVGMLEEDNDPMLSHQCGHCEFKSSPCWPFCLLETWQLLWVSPVLSVFSLHNAGCSGISKIFLSMAWNIYQINNYGAVNHKSGQQCIVDRKIFWSVNVSPGRIKWMSYSVAYNAESFRIAVITRTYGLSSSSVIDLWQILCSSVAGLHPQAPSYHHFKDHICGKSRLHPGGLRRQQHMYVYLSL